MTVAFYKGELMKNAAFLLSIFSLSTALVGCGGGSSAVISGAGKRCSADGAAYNPIPVDTSAEKISMKAEDKAMPQGQYAYAGSQLYYYDSKTKTQIHLNEDANFKSSVVCMRNMPVGDKAISEENTIASTMSVKNNAYDFEVRNMIFTFDKDSVSLVTKPKEKGSFKSAEEVFASKNSHYQFYKTSDAGYEARATRTMGTVRIDVIVNYTLKK